MAQNAGTREQKAAVPTAPAPGLFDMPTPVGAKPTTPADSDEEVEILAEIKQETEEEDEEVVVS
jgi:hypothetical protein